MAKKIKPRYVIHAAHGAKEDRFSVFDTQTGRDVKGRLTRQRATLLRAFLNGRTPREPESGKFLWLRARHDAARIKAHVRRRVSVRVKPKRTKKRSDRFIYGKHGYIVGEKP